MHEKVESSLVEMHNNIAAAGNQGTVGWVYLGYLLLVPEDSLMYEGRTLTSRSVSAGFRALVVQCNVSP